MPRPPSSAGLRRRRPAIGRAPPSAPPHRPAPGRAPPSAALSAATEEISRPRFIGPGCSTGASSASRSSRRRAQPVARSRTRARSGSSRAVIRSRCTRSIITASTSPAALPDSTASRSQLGRAVPGVDAGRHQRRRGDQGDPRAEGVEQQHVGPGHPAVRDVADDDDVPVGEIAQPLAQREGVQQRLGGVLVRAVAGVDDRAVDPTGDPLHRAGRVVPHHQRVDAHRGDGQRRCRAGSRPC